MKPTRLFLALFALFLIPLLPSARADNDPGKTPAPAVAPFKDGDAICFVGDSITRGGWFHSFVYQFYATRYPNLKLRTFNCGKSGDNATGTLQRLPWDCLQNKPNVAVVMLGMNDAPVEGSQDRALASLEKLIVALKQAGCRVIQVGPTIYDETVELPKEANKGKNAALARYAVGVREMAKRLGNDFVDFNVPMQRINVEHQKADPKYTLIGPDRVHPGEPGHLVMAYEFLKAQGMSPIVSRIVLDAAAPAAVEQDNCKIEAVQSAAGGLRFTCTENSLPFVPTEKALPGLELVPFTQDLNNETLIVRNAPAGTYDLKIDGKSVGQYTAEQLAKGINLAGNANTPQYQQSMKITHANDRRHLIESFQMRGIALVHGMLKKANINPDDASASEKYLRDFIAARANDKPSVGRAASERYLQSWNKNKTKDLALMESLIESIRHDAQPVAHAWELVRKP